MSDTLRERCERTLREEPHMTDNCIGRPRGEKGRPMSDTKNAPAEDRHYDEVNKLLGFIEKTSGKRLSFKTIVNVVSGHTTKPEDRIAAWLANREAQVRAEKDHEADALIQTAINQMLHFYESPTNATLPTVESVRKSSENQGGRR